ncbi:nucleoside hydrolase [Streptomyces sp. NPDC052013]|uniref:nucleoside hydrolase n=1 Tax=Streptomyces sp. NPDC052013 TaxID=3365679 RepID=UPI0037D0151E
MVLDTDMGVDDAAALAWMVSQSGYPIRLLGVGTVWGNTTAEQAAQNATALLRILGHSHIPVAIGATEPIKRAGTSLGAFLHGVDGLWGCTPGQWAVPDCRVRDLYAAAVEHDDVILVTTGPLTNLARLLTEDSGILHAFREIIVLGGARYGGSITPVAEANFWHDPEAADRVLSAGLPITLILRDAHTAFQLDERDLVKIQQSSTPAAAFLAQPLTRFAAAQASVGRSFHCPDVVAAVCAADPSMILNAHHGLVRVVVDSYHLARGQTVIGFTPQEKISLLKDAAALNELATTYLMDPEFNFGEQFNSLSSGSANNAKVVLCVDAARIKSEFMFTMRQVSDELC